MRAWVVAVVWAMAVIECSAVRSVWDAVSRETMNERRRVEHARIMQRAHALKRWQQTTSTKQDCSGQGMRPPPSGCGGMGSGNTGGNTGGGTGGSSCSSRDFTAGYPAQPCGDSSMYLGNLGYTAWSSTSMMGISPDLAADGTYLYDTYNGGQPAQSIDQYGNIYGAFEAGFTDRQDSVIQAIACGSDTSSCTSPCNADPSLGYLPGGLDVASAEEIFANACQVTMGLYDDGGTTYSRSMLDYCGAHAEPYHIHDKLWCLYDRTASGHSSVVGYAIDGQLIYGKWEATVNGINVAPDTDACLGHFGVTPDSTGEVVYHYHTQDESPFDPPCMGPDMTTDSGLVQTATCRELFNDGQGCKNTAVTDNNGITHVHAPGGVSWPTDLYCPCHDGGDRGDGAGNNLDTGTDSFTIDGVDYDVSFVNLPAFSNTAETTIDTAKPYDVKTKADSSCTLAATDPQAGETTTQLCCGSSGTWSCQAVTPSKYAADVQTGAVTPSTSSSSSASPSLFLSSSTSPPHSSSASMTPSSSASESETPSISLSTSTTPSSSASTSASPLPSSSTSRSVAPAGDDNGDNTAIVAGAAIGAVAVVGAAAAACMIRQRNKKKVNTHDEGDAAL